MVRIRLVISPPRRPIVVLLEAPLPVRVTVALDDAAVETLIEALEHLPLGGRDGHVVGEGAVVVFPVVDEELEGGGHGVVIGVRGLIVGGGGGGAEGEVAEAELEVDGVFVGGLPLEDVLVGAEFVAGGGKWGCWEGREGEALPGAFAGED